MGRSVLFRGGRVYTGRRYAEALLLEDGVVVAVGEEGAVRRQAPTGAESVDLAGSLVVPGLLDAHVHLGELARAAAGPVLSGGGDLPRLSETLRAWSSAHPGGAIEARGFDLSGLAPSTWPTAADLDRAVADRPVVVHDASGHVALLNSLALARVDPADAARASVRSGIRRGADGAPTGVLVEEAARRLAGAVFAHDRPSPTDLRPVLVDLARRGVTAVGAMSVGPEELAALRELDDSAGPLPFVAAYVRASRFFGPGARASLPERGGPVAVVGVKAFLDGAFGPRTASLFEPYSDLAGARGEPVLTDEALSGLLAEVGQRGLAPALHAIGDAAVTQAAQALGAQPARGGRPPRVEHASLLTPPALAALAASGATAVVQPGFLLTDTWLASRLGEERRRWAYPFRTLLDHGVRLAGSSDAPYGPLDPWAGIRAAVRRRDAEGRSANRAPWESLPVEEALGLYTTGGAQALGYAGGGLLEPGAPGDLVVLRTRTLAEALEVDAPVAQTWIRGQLAFTGRSFAPDQVSPRATV